MKKQSRKFVYSCNLCGREESSDCLPGYWLEFDIYLDPDCPQYTGTDDCPYHKVETHLCEKCREFIKQAEHSRAILSPPEFDNPFKDRPLEARSIDD